MTTTLILIRHGETPYNRDRRYQGHRDTLLTRKGKRQTKEITIRLKNEPLDAIYSSDLKRTRYTAKVVNRYHFLKINILPELREIDFGDWEGKTHDEIQREWKGLLAKWEKGPSKIKIPRGESIKDLAERVRSTIEKIIGNHPDQRIAIVTHGGPIRIILMDALGLGLDDWWKTITSNGGISIIEYQSNKGKVLLQNDTSHLEISKKIRNLRLQ
jgi:alpha-ribazole phosphatase